MFIGASAQESDDHQDRLATMVAGRILATERVGETSTFSVGRTPDQRRHLEVPALGSTMALSVRMSLPRREANMEVREIMSTDLETCRADDTLDRAARLMWEHDCGVVPVVDHEGTAVGMITDRDICMAAYTQGRPL